MSPNDADGMANSVDPDQTAPLGAVWSGSALFAQTCLSENLGSLRYLSYDFFAGSKGGGYIPDPVTPRPTYRPKTDRPGYTVNPHDRDRVTAHPPYYPDSGDKNTLCSHSIDAITVIRKEIFIFIGSVRTFFILTHICPVDPLILINWTSPFPILGVSGVLFHFYSISNRNTCKQTV